ncbi:SDR family oxidoreductase [Parasphaerochaeta coccoides]|uniref:3-oxoacyl-(Acyl-carrier-protein) reductase n=1 Tax=Parasphaerochaeta coccoides (strain ATCC BAA-1237 / DSM 17374 / SPN1) TaxID=760011 RepID=F4GHK2_PARC1|nr:SDR family oxidoreductase [Parasphaerochaeta coccoides]AEC02591.1 3-oxoacyl-(acyl-carrier-protein) reductase [Parasphaerochaeta coccoides DSM 17374]
MGLFDLTGKKAIVTGASSGLGVQFALALARQGADVAVVARRVEKLQDVQKQIESLGVKSIALKCDVSKSSDIASVVAEVKKQFGRIDILVNNAGIALAGPAEAQDDELWTTMMNVNINGVYYFAREAGKVMLEQKYGKIINIGSIHSTVAMKGLPLTAYCTTKGGVEMLTKALANEWAKKGITVNAIGPAYFPSEMTGGLLANEGMRQLIETSCPMGRPGRDGELDGALIYFASDASSYTTGQLLTVDGGWTTI